MISRFFTLMVAIMALSPVPAAAQPDPVAPYRAMRNAFIEDFRVSGRLDPSRLAPAARDLATLAASATGPTKAQALFELGTIQRMRNEYAGAAVTLAQAALVATDAGRRDVAFDAWIGVARANAYGTSDHGAAALAFDRAADIAGDAPTPKQKYDLAAYQAQLKAARGEIESALIDALEAMRLAPDDKDRFYAELDVADALQKLAESCDYRPLRDARSDRDGTDRYAACRRAVTAGQSGYDRAARTADKLGWRSLAAQSRRFHTSLDLRRQLIEFRAKGEALPLAGIFAPSGVRDILVTRDFASGASTLTDQAALATLTEQVVAEADARTGRADARSNYLRGLAADIRGGKPEATAGFFAEAAGQLAAERGAFFDPRRRGTVIENRGEIVRDLGLQLLALGREAEAFAAFESVRARGLGEIAAALARPDVSAADRAWLASLLKLEARASAIETGIVGRVVATGQLDAGETDLAALATVRAERQRQLRANEAARARFAAAPAAPASLDALRAAAKTAGVPVLLYWTTNTNVIVWVVGPRGSDVHSVFLPQSVLAEKIGRVVASSAGSDSQQPFDETAARELFLFLVAPFLDQLDSPQVLIVPHGPLAALPFEALIDPSTRAPMIETHAVSYAPNATMALQALQRPARTITRVTALIDPEIDDITREKKAIEAAGVTVLEVARDQVAASLPDTDAMHLLMHGTFDASEPLLSRLIDRGAPNDPLLAADLLALPLGGLKLAVLSACEGGQVGTRISNEIYGFPWALLAGGVEATVLSRWRVNGASNSVWMGAFYRSVAAGASPSMAAATAMRHMRKSGYPHPYHWAAMQAGGR